MNVAALKSMNAEVDATTRPIEDLCAAARQAAPIRDIGMIHDAPWFSDLTSYFDGYPAHALTQPACRAFMYEAVRTLRPKFILEIGTYCAGTTEVMARAVHANGGGLVLTIDPYGGGRVPGILAGWPEALNALVNFIPATSMDLFIQLDRLASPVDLAFVDGNHAYAFAYYDLAAAAKWVAPGGVVVMDDFDQPGVFWAVKHFLDAHGDWKEISGVFDDFDSGAPFESMRPSVRGTKFLVLQRAARVTLGHGTPLSFDIARLAEPGLSGLRLGVEAGTAGTMHAKVFLRSFYVNGSDGDPEQVQTVVSAPVAADQGLVDLPFGAPLFSSHPQDGTRREVEIVLIWQPATGDAPLSLTRPPQVIPAHQGASS